MRFKISFHREPGYFGYKVNIPNYLGGEVVTADVADGLIERLQETTAALQAFIDSCLYSVASDAGRAEEFRPLFDAARAAIKKATE